MSKEALCKKKRVSARARVTVTLEIEVTDSWGTDCTVQQVHQQATESALGVIRRVKDRGYVDYRIIGEPTVLTVIVEQE